ncbi:MAG: 50S ribosomal protein L31, partial [Bacilli bacterium]|nr:50S ribosomal protein L31 [Bacilli bacterium]
SECHPVYTGQQGKVKKTGNIEKFNKKFGFDKEQK